MRYQIFLKENINIEKSLRYDTLLYCESIFCSLINHIGYNYEELIIYAFQI